MAYCMLHSHKCINNGLLLWLVAMYILHRMSTQLTQNLVSSPWQAQIKPKDKAQLNPLQNCYIAIAEGFASLKKELQSITPYLF